MTFQGDGIWAGAVLHDMAWGGAFMSWVLLPQRGLEWSGGQGHQCLHGVPVVIHHLGAPVRP